MDQKLEKKLKELVSTVFEIKIDEIDDSTSPDTVEKWDSLQQLNLAMAIENEFKITLSPNDITDMLSYKLIKQILLEKFK
jgi:acyl carrier protein|tara:strand:+ start:286 stop:525 length:240 start_codon:yes stop_codon:yes gene_type:complete